MSGAPWLLVDAGNSRIKWALVSPAETGSAAALRDGAFDHGNAQGGPDWSDLPRPASAWIANVAGTAAAERIDHLIDTRWPALPRTFVQARAQQCGVTNGYANPAQLGADRWCGLIGAHAAYPGEHVLVATFGTATTLEALRADGCFTGGLIAPGWVLMMQSLGTHTAQLPTLSSDTARHALTGDLFATDTRAGLSAGCLLAQAGFVERAWHDLCEQWQADVRLVVCGGAAGVVADALKVPHTRHDSLVIPGLALIARDTSAHLP
jgi:type III pantothenate kinase